MVTDVANTLKRLRAATNDDTVVETIDEIWQGEDLDEDQEIEIFRGLARQLQNGAMAGDIDVARAAATIMEEIDPTWTELAG